MFDFNTFFDRYRREQEVTVNKLSAMNRGLNSMNLNFQELIEMQKDQIRREERRNEQEDITTRENELESDRTKKHQKEVEGVAKKTFDELGNIKTKYFKLFNPKIIGAAIGIAVVDAMSGANIRQAGFAAGVGAELLRVGKALKPLIATGKEIGKFGKSIRGVVRVFGTIGKVFKPIFKLLTRASILLTPIIALFTGFVRAMKSFQAGGSFNEIVMSAITGVLDSLIIDLIDGISTLAGWIGKFFENLPKLLEEASDPNSATGKIWNEFTTKLGEAMGKLAETVWSMIKSIFSSIWEIIWDSEGKFGLGLQVGVAVAAFVLFNASLVVATGAMTRLATMSGAAAIGLGGRGLLGGIGGFALKIGLAAAALGAISSIRGSQEDSVVGQSVSKGLGAGAVSALGMGTFAGNMGAGLGGAAGKGAASAAGKGAASAAGGAAGQMTLPFGKGAATAAGKSSSSWLGRAWNSTGGAALRGVGRAASAVGSGIAGAAVWTKDAVKGMSKAVMQSTLGKFLGRNAQSVLKFLGKAPVISTLIETWFANDDIQAIKGNPELTADEKRKAIGKRLGQAIGGIIGGAGGFALGVPLGAAVTATGFGAPVGWLVPLVTAFLGDMLGRWVGGLLADAVGSENIFSVFESIGMVSQPEDGPLSGGAGAAGAGAGAGAPDAAGAGAGAGAPGAAGGGKKPGAAGGGKKTKSSTGTALITAAGAGAGAASMVAASKSAGGGIMTGAGGGGGGVLPAAAAAGGIGVLLASDPAADPSLDLDPAAVAAAKEAAEIKKFSDDLIAESADNLAKELGETTDKIKESGEKTEEASNVLTKTVDSLKAGLSGLGGGLVEIPTEVTSQVGEFTKGIMGAMGNSVSTALDIVKGKSLGDMLGSLSHASAQGAARTYGFKGKGGIFGRGNFGGSKIGEKTDKPLGFGFPGIDPFGFPGFPPDVPMDYMAPLPGSFGPGPGVDNQGSHLMDSSLTNSMASSAPFIMPVSSTSSNQVVHNSSSNTTLALGNIHNEDKSIMMTMLHDNIHESLI